MTTTPSTSWKRALPPLGVASLVFLASIFASWTAYSVYGSRDRERFESRVAEISDAIEGRLDAYTVLLHSASALLAGRDFVDPDRFRAFVETLDLHARYAGLAGHRLRRSRTGGRPGGLRGARSHHGRDAVHDPPCRAPRGVPPRGGPRAARREEQCCARPRPRDPPGALGGDGACARLGPPGGVGHGAAGDAGAGGSARRLRGLPAGLPLRWRTSRRDRAPQGPARLRLQPVRHRRVRGGERAATRGPRRSRSRSTTLPARRRSTSSETSSAARGGSPTYSTTRKINLAGRDWTVAFHTTPPFDEASGLPVVPWILGGGLLISGLLFVAMRAQAEARHEAERNADVLQALLLARRESEARRAAILESSLDAIVAMDESARITEFNRAAEHAFGFTRAEVLGRDLFDTIIPTSYRQTLRDGVRALPGRRERCRLAARTPRRGDRAPPRRPRVRGRGDGHRDPPRPRPGVHRAHPRHHRAQGVRGDAAARARDRRDAAPHHELVRRQARSAGR